MGAREALLQEIRERMLTAGIFRPDVWERMLLTETAMLFEIASADPPFETEVAIILAERKAALN